MFLTSWHIVFVHVEEQGPPHARTFTWSCSFLEVKEIVLSLDNAPPTNIIVTFTHIALIINPSLPSQGQYSSIGKGRSKKEAKNESAKNLITQLDLNTLPQVKLVIRERL